MRSKRLIGLIVSFLVLVVAGLFFLAFGKGYHLLTIFYPSAGSHIVSQQKTSAVQNVTANKAAVTSPAWQVFTVPVADTRGQHDVYRVLTEDYGLTPYLGPRGQVVLNASPGTPGGGLAWFGYDPPSGTWHYHFAPEGAFLFVGTSGIWASNYSSGGKHWTLYRWRNGQFQANPALRNIPETPPGNSSGWYGDAPIPSGGLYLHFRNHDWFQGRPLVWLGNSLTGRTKGSLVVIPVGSGSYYHSVSTAAVPSGTSLIFFSPHHISSLGFNPVKGFSAPFITTGAFPKPRLRYGIAGDGQGGVWYLSGSSASPLLCYWRAGLMSPEQWPVPVGALSKGWGQGLIPGTDGVCLVRYGGCPHPGNCSPAEENVSNRVYVFDKKAGTWQEPVLPSWWWNARGSGLVGPLPDGNLLAVGLEGNIGLISPDGAFRSLMVTGWPAGYTPNGLAIDSAGNAWVTAYRTVNGIHHWILAELVIK